MHISFNEITFNSHWLQIDGEVIEADYHEFSLEINAEIKGENLVSLYVIDFAGRFNDLGFNETYFNNEYGRPNGTPFQMEMAFTSDKQFDLEMELIKDSLLSLSTAHRGDLIHFHNEEMNLYLGTEEHFNRVMSVGDEIFPLILTTPNEGELLIYGEHYPALSYTLEMEDSVIFDHQESMLLEFLSEKYGNVTFDNKHEFKLFFDIFSDFFRVYGMGEHTLNMAFSLWHREGDYIIGNVIKYGRPKVGTVLYDRRKEIGVTKYDKIITRV